MSDIGNVIGLGGGPPELNKAEIDKNAYYDTSRLDQNSAQAQNFMNQAQNRQAPTMGAAQVGPAGQANLSQASAARLGPAAQMEAASLGNAGNDFRAMQSGLGSQLQQQANQKGLSEASQLALGQSLAQNRAAARSAALSERGFGNTAANARQLAYGAGAANQGAAIAATGLGIQERQAAQQQLAGLAQTARQQDIGAAEANARLLQEARLTNMGAQNQFGLQQGQFDQAAALQNAQMANNMSQFNTGAANEFALEQARMQQAAAANNQQASLNMTNMNDAQTRAMLAMQQANNNQAFNQQNAFNQLNVQNTQAQNQLEQSAYDASMQRGMDMVGGVAGAAAGLAMMSDERQKKDKKKMSDSEVSDLLGKLESSKKSAISAMNSDKPEVEQLQARGDEISDQLANTKVAYPTLQPSALERQRQAGSGMVSQGLSSIGRGGAFTQAGNNLMQMGMQKQQDDRFQAARQGMAAGRGAYGASALASDERAKLDQGKFSEAELSDFINNLEGHKYKYKDPNRLGADEKTHYGNMAQELEQSKIGKSAVYNHGGTKMVDYGRLSEASLAVLANLNRRVKKLEK